MNLETNKKRTIITLYKEIIASKISEKASINKESILQYLDEIKLDENDYKLIIDLVKEEINSQKYSIQATQLQTIVSILKSKPDYKNLEILCEDSEPTILFNSSYLINYDEIEAKWYIALVNTITLELLKEIYNGNYTSFITYISTTNFQ